MLLTFHTEHIIYHRLPQFIHVVCVNVFVYWQDLTLTVNSNVEINNFGYVFCNYVTSISQ